MSDKIKLMKEIITELNEVKDKIPWYLALAKATVLGLGIAALVAAIASTSITGGALWISIIASVAGIMATVYWIFDQIHDDAYERGKLDRKQEELKNMTSSDAG